MSRTFLLLHGLFNHRPPEHWQHWLAGELRAAGERVLYPQLPDPDAPSLAGWKATLHEQLAEAGEDERVVLCHSLSALLWVHAAAEVRADRLLLVAPPASTQVPDEGADFRLTAAGPAALDGDAVRRSVATRVRLVRSDDDPYDPDGAGETIAAAIGADVDVLPGAGHINPDSGYGPWPALLAWCRDPAARLTPNR